MEYWPFEGACIHHIASYSKLYLVFCHLASLFKFLPQSTPPLALPAHPLIYVGPVLMNSMKKLSKLVTISHYVLASLVVQANRQLSSYYYAH